MLRWTLLAHSGYVTYPHKDANGLCTWIFAHAGIKIWAILEPRYVSKQHKERFQQFKLHCKMLNTPLSWEYEQCSGTYSMFLAPGDMLWVYLFDLSIICDVDKISLRIMPPGTWHAVYTATASNTDGGHFMMYDTLHLTEFSRAFDHKYSKYSTNANHQVDRILSRLTLALPVTSQTRSQYHIPRIAFI